MMWNNISGGDCSTAMALLNPKVPCVIVNTGGNYPWAWRQIEKLRKKRITIITLSSSQQGYPTYFDYVWKSNKIPFFKGCCERGKDRHLDRFYKTIPGHVTVNVGFIKGEESRAERLARLNTKKRKFNFPMLTYTREQCEKILKKNGFDSVPRTGCWFCPKQDNPPEWAIKAIISKEGQEMRARSRGLVDTPVSEIVQISDSKEDEA